MLPIFYILLGHFDCFFIYPLKHSSTFRKTDHVNAALGRKYFRTTLNHSPTDQEEVESAHACCVNQSNMIPLSRRYLCRRPQVNFFFALSSNEPTCYNFSEHTLNLFNFVSRRLKKKTFAETEFKLLPCMYCLHG